MLELSSGAMQNCRSVNNAIKIREVLLLAEKLCLEKRVRFKKQTWTSDTGLGLAMPLKKFNRKTKDL